VFFACGKLDEKQRKYIKGFPQHLVEIVEKCGK